jgi:large subunit ribosomal protein L6
MSRIGRKPVALPEKVKIAVDGATVSVEGPLGKIEHTLPLGLTVDVADGQAKVNPPAQLNRTNKGFLGLGRALLANMVEGVTKGYERKLVITGVGYRANLQGDKLTLQLGFSHDIVVTVPQGVKCEVDKSQTKLKFSGVDKQVVGNIAARVRNFKRAEPYKGKGVTYEGEVIRRKVGKAGGK